jgi:sphingomyelin phosphodiesterase acid-like 3
MGAAARKSFRILFLLVNSMKSYIYKTHFLHLAANTRVACTAPPGGVPFFVAKTRLALVLLFAAFLLSTAGSFAQSPIESTGLHPAFVYALFLSDIHLDPYADPAKVAKLNAAPVADWSAILAAPTSPTQAQDSAALQQTCPVRGVDTPNALWLSSLHAIRTNAANVKFVTLSGDLLAHSFDCKFKTLLPAATHADYLAFTEKTIRYIVSGLRATLPGVPLYVAMGNNDSGCTDYQLDASHDPFLALTAKVVAEALPTSLPAADRDAVLADFSAGGYYDVPLAAVAHTRLIVLDDLFLSASYAACSGKPDPAPAAAQLAWLEARLAAARKRNERVWVMGHIPPGVNLYATARKLTNVCAGGKAQMFLGSEKLEEVLAGNADVIQLALFGHTHSDEMRLLLPEVDASDSAAPAPAAKMAGVPLKVVASITPVNGNRPTFTLASIDPATATLVDYTVIMASNLTGIDTTWAPEYTYSTAYQQPAFNSAAVSTLIAGFQADPSASSAASQNYLRTYSPGGVSAIIQFVWPQYACSLNHDSASEFSTCACATLSK